MKIRGGYLKLQEVVKTVFNEEEVLFNIKSIFTLLRIFQKPNRKHRYVELMYGKDQILCHLSKNPHEYKVYEPN